MSTKPAQVGWASVRGGKWHATPNPTPSWYPRGNTEETVCGLTIEPVNVTFAADKPTTHGGRRCENCLLRLPTVETERPDVRLTAVGASIIVHVNGAERGYVYWHAQIEQYVAMRRDGRCLGQSPLRVAAIALLTA